MLTDHIRDTFGIKQGQLYRSSDNRTAMVLEVRQMDFTECEVDFKYNIGNWDPTPIETESISRFMEIFPDDSGCFQSDEREVLKSPGVSVGTEPERSVPDGLEEIKPGLYQVAEAIEEVIDDLEQAVDDLDDDDEITGIPFHIKNALQDIDARELTVAGYIVIDPELEQLQFIVYRDGYVSHISSFFDGIDVYGTTVGQGGMKSMGGLSAIKTKVPEPEVADDEPESTYRDPVHQDVIHDGVSAIYQKGAGLIRALVRWYRLQEVK